MLRESDEYLCIILNCGQHLSIHRPFYETRVLDKPSGGPLSRHRATMRSPQSDAQKFKMKE